MNMNRWLEGKFKRWLVRGVGWALRTPRIPAGSIRPQEIRTVLLIKTQDWLGDAVMVTPVIQAIYEGWPHVFVDVVTRPDLAPIFRGDTRLRRVWEYDKQKMKGLSYAWRWLQRLRAERYDLTVVLGAFSYSVTSVGLAAVSGARIRVGFSGESYGYSGISEALLTTVVPVRDDHDHAVRRLLSLVQWVGIESRSENHRLETTPVWREQARAFFAKAGYRTGLLVGLHLGSRKPHQRWPVAWFREVGEALAERYGAMVVVTVGPGEEALATAYQEGLKKPVVVLQQPLPEVLGYLTCLDALVSVDTGMLHLAAGVGVPTVGIFVEGEVERWAPLGPSHRALQAVLHKPETVSVAQVLEGIENVLSSQSSFVNDRREPQGYPSRGLGSSMM